MKPMTDQPKDPESKPSHEEVAKKAYAIYQKEGSPQGHAKQPRRFKIIQKHEGKFYE